MGKIQILGCVLDELQGLSRNIPDAKAALALADLYETVPSQGKGDDCILEMAVQLGGIVLTNDRELIKRLKEKGVRVVSIRSGKTINFV